MSSPTVHLGESEVDLVSSNLRLCTRCILTLSSLSDSSVQFPKSQLDLSKSSMLLVLPPNCSSPRPPSSSASLTSNLRLLASSPLTSTSCSSFLSSSSPSCPSALPTSSTTTSDSSPPVSESSLSSSQCQASKATCSPSKTAPATFNKLYYSLCSSPLTGSLKSPCEWIVRGGGLKLSIEPLDGNYFTSSHFLDAAFKKGLCSILTQAEVIDSSLLGYGLHPLKNPSCGRKFYSLQRLASQILPKVSNLISELFHIHWKPARVQL